jgi:hypothetical protein
MAAEIGDQTGGPEPGGLNSPREAVGLHGEFAVRSFTANAKGAQSPAPAAPGRHGEEG